jgi:hypothetical protein
MRIAISGTACQGKTTLIKDFLREWDMYSTPAKTYRDYLTENNLPHSKETTKDTQWDVLNFMVDSLQQYSKGDKVIFDRCPLDNMVYSLWAYEKSINDIDDDFIKKCIPVVRESLRFLDVIFFVPITKAAPIQIEEDELRETDKLYIEEVDNIFKGIERQYLQGQKSSPFLPNEECPAIVEVFGNREQRLHLIRQYIDAEGDLMGENESSILGEEVLDMEQILRDQQREMNIDKMKTDALYKKIEQSRNH